MNRLEAFDDRDAWADAAAEAIAERAARPRAADLPRHRRDDARTRSMTAFRGWTSTGRNTTVVPTDDRFVDPASPDSNEPLLRGHLLVERAAAARFLPLKGKGATPGGRRRGRGSRARARCFPPARFFWAWAPTATSARCSPPIPDLAARLDPDGDRLVVGTGVSSEKPFVPRISLTARAILETGLIVRLHQRRREAAVVERVLAGHSLRPADRHAPAAGAHAGARDVGGLGPLRPPVELDLD